MHVGCASALSTRARRGLVSAVDAGDALHVVLNAPVLIRPSAALVARAHALSVDLRQSAYERLYLALAVAEDAVLVTACERFARAVAADPAVGRLARALEGGFLRNGLSFARFGAI